jgi:hypothetical protein
MRCYSKKYQKLYYSSYIGCTVCNEWLNFQTFADWYNEHLYKIPNERVEIDKDILIPNNKVYSPETCMIVPQSINLLFSRHNAKDDRELPTGICKQKSGKYSVCFTYKGVNNRFGKINTLEEAVKIYNECKEKYIRIAAEDYKQYISQQLYDVLKNYKML